jgi:hypothetical protein
VSGLVGAVHLLPAGELFEQGYPDTSMAVCGEPVDSKPTGENDPRYCPECVRATIRCSAQPPGTAGGCGHLGGSGR